MRISVLSVSPESFESFSKSSVINKARKNNGLELEVVDIRDYAQGSFRMIDDSPYG